MIQAVSNCVYVYRLSLRLWFFGNLCRMLQKYVGFFGLGEFFHIELNAQVGSKPQNLEPILTKV